MVQFLSNFYTVWYLECREQGMQEARLDHAAPTAVLLERDGRFFVYQPGLALVASGESVEAAYSKFFDARRSFFDEVKRAGLTTDPVSGQPPVVGAAQFLPGRGFVGELGLFLAKTSIVLLIVAGVGIAGVTAINRAVDRTVASIAPEIARTSTGVREMLPEITSEIARTSSGARELLKDLQIAVKEVQAAVKEAQASVKEVQSMGGISMVDVANKAAVIVQDVEAMPQERKESLRKSVGILSRELSPIIEAWRNPPPLPDPTTAPASPSTK